MEFIISIIYEPNLKRQRWKGRLRAPLKVESKIMKFIFLPLILSSYLAYGFDLELGLAGIEEQDSRLSPALMTGVESERFGARLYSSGQKVSGYTRNLHILSLYPGKINISESFSARVGLATTRLHYSHSSGSTDSYNFGALFGLGYRYGIFRLNWDSHLYFGGFSGILLVTGRQQALSFGLGFSL
jgi:hypothetical protein